MVETPSHATINIYLQLDNGLKFKVNEINRTKHYFMVEIFER